MRILFLSRWFPFPTDNGSKLRVSNLLHGLSQQHDVTLLSFTDQPNHDLSGTGIQSVCSDAHVISGRGFAPRGWRAQLGFLSSRPRFLVDTYSQPMERLIRSSIARNKYDLVIASQLSMASYHSCLQGIPAMFEEMEIGWFYDKATQGKSFHQFRLRLTWLKLCKYLGHILRAFRVCTVVSEQERQLFTANFPEHGTKVHVIPNCIPVRQYQGAQIEPAPHQLIFTGSFRYAANYEGAQWFVREVLPLILKRLPDARLVITGDHANLPFVPASNVTLTGQVDDIRPLVAASRVGIVPLFSGGGTRLKILEAMAMGTPVVATSKGAEGLELIPGEHFLVADSPVSFAEQVLRVLNDNALHDRLSAQARKFVQDRYDSEVVVPHFVRLVESVAG